jgi:predicted RNA-binding Zn ribbon-like protein
MVQAFVNTLDIENGIEELQIPKDLQALLVRIGALDEGAPPLGDVDLLRALEVREALRRLLLANNGVPVDPEALAALEASARAAHLSLAFAPEGQSSLSPQAPALDGALGRILSVVHDSMAAGTWPRLKACRRDVCHWVFYDRSKNRSSTWCAMSVCGNRTKKKRAYRRKLSTSSDGAEAAAPA